jgi:glycerol-3-phosphate dehydrogenase subunit B
MMNDNSQTEIANYRSQIVNQKSKIVNQYDTVVIGAGLAGLTTACRLAQANKRVLVVAGGAGALLLASGCIDVLGFQPVHSLEPVENPLDKLDDFLSEHPEHPYRFIGRENIEAGLNEFLQLVNNGRLDYRGAAHRNWLLPGAAGAVHPTCLAPVSVANGDFSAGGRMLIVGFKELRDFYPALISQNINGQSLGVKSASLGIEAPPPVAGRMNITPIELAHAFEQADFRRRVVKMVKSAGKGYGRIGFPAVLGLERHNEVLADLQKRLGKTVFEISTLPPSVPGRRLFEALKQRFLQTGTQGRLILGAKVVDGVIEEGRVTQIRIETASRLKPIKAETYVLATGGIFGGGIQTNAGGRVWEPIFGLPVAADSNRHKWFTKQFLSPQGQPVARYGVRVNQHLNPVNGDGTPVATNLYLAGSVMAGYEWTSGRTGDGVAVAAAAAIADQISNQANLNRSNP